MANVFGALNSRNLGISGALASAILLASPVAFAADPDQPHIDKARLIYQRLAGRTPKITEANFVAMVADVKAGRLVDAAAKASSDAGFVNNTLRLFAAPINAKSQTYQALDLTPGMAYIMGKVRDGAPIKQLLTGKDYYNIDLTGVTCNNNENPFACATRLDLDLSTRLVLSNTPQQPIMSTTNGANGGARQPAQVPASEIAGLFTMEGFGSAGLFAGTNRAPIQQFYNQLWCTPNQNLRATQDVIGKWVGRDISRDPEGTGLTVFRKECQSCHFAIDGMRGAFAFFDTVDVNDRNLVAYAANAQGVPTNAVVPKYARGVATYPAGYAVVDNSWELMFTAAQKATLGYDGSGPTSGRGVASMAEALTHFDALEKCMVKKAAELVCPVDPNLSTLGTNQLLSDKAKQEFVDELKNSGNLRKIFEMIAVRPECLGK